MREHRGGSLGKWSISWPLVQGAMTLHWHQKATWAQMRLHWFCKMSLNSDFCRSLLRFKCWVNLWRQTKYCYRPHLAHSLCGFVFVVGVFMNACKKQVFAKICKSFLYLIEYFIENDVKKNHKNTNNNYVKNFSTLINVYSICIWFCNTSN